MADGALKQVYDGLSKYEQQLLQVLAVAERQLSLVELQKVFKRCGWASAPTKTGEVSQALLKTWGESLRRHQLVNHTNLAVGMQVSFNAIDFGVQQAVRADNASLIADGVNAIDAPYITSQWSWGFTEYRVASYRRKARLAFYRGDVDSFQTVMHALEKQFPSHAELELLSSFDAEFFAKTPDALKPNVLMRETVKALYSYTGSRTLLELFDAYGQSQPEVSTEFGEMWVNLCLARGDIAGLKRLAEMQKPFSLLASACAAFLEGRHAEAEAAFHELGRGPGTKNRKVSLLPELHGLVQMLVLLRKNDPQSRSALKTLSGSIKNQWRTALCTTNKLFKLTATYAEAPSAAMKQLLIGELVEGMNDRPVLTQVLAAHIKHWILRSDPGWPKYQGFEAASKIVSKAAQGYERLGLDWLCALCEDVGQVVLKSDNATTQPGQRHRRLGTVPMLDWIEPVAVWRCKLDMLRAIASDKSGRSNSGTTAAENAERLIWEISLRDVEPLACVQLTPHLQKFTGKSWSKGRPIALKRLHEELQHEDFICLTDQDRAVCRCIERKEFRTGYYRSTTTVYEFDFGRAMSALVGHPYVFTAGNRELPIEIISKPPQLVISKQKQGLQVALEPKPKDGQAAVLKKDGAQRLIVVRFTDAQLKLAATLEGALEIPQTAVDDLLEVAKSLSGVVSVQSEVAFDSTGSGAAGVSTPSKSVKAQPRTQLHLLPFHAGLRGEFFVQPFGDTGPCYVPGHGGANVCAEVDGEFISTARELKREIKLAKEVIAACSTLADAHDGKSFVFEYPTADEALEMLLDVEPLRASGQLTLTWPQGQPLRVAGRAEGKQLKVRIERDRDWFSASGELLVNESLSIDMLELLNLISGTPGRFVQLNDGSFLALTERLRQQVAELSAFGEATKTGLRIPQIRAAAMTDLDQWCSLKADKHWKAQLKKISEAGEVTVDVPTTLNAELRDYQVEGFRWLSRLAHWGAGACLADDMGLGKTLQAIALLLRRGADGPALVIAPTSVCFNWEAELRRFAPTLNPRVFGAGDRDAFFKDLGPRDVVILSYGLLNTEVERLQTTHWSTAILDEAQAIKNMQTKRSQAAMSLKADFRLIMTGTPIENHLGELWNLFQFINPGLLGSTEQYQQRFATPIERDQNRDVRQQLKRLVQPFLLRRTKRQVLSELPPRTEVTVPVTLSEEETALYEAARQRAVAELTSDTDVKGKHLRILAEITRLRRACCHPSLLAPNCLITGSKLAAFAEKIDELIENKHKALVFSQFVDHLAILRGELDRRGVKYQYLDGSTPQAERKRSVDAFQNGDGDVFLISLKAGGTGLNLTAADYVLHMDPWWNPAVEDQAADRAHRMGQLRPVTIYRFITRGTIEEKILELHATKRDLADSLLEGTDSTGRLSAEELLALMR